MKDTIKLVIISVLLLVGIGFGPLFSKSWKGDNAVRVLEGDGYANVQLTGYKWFTCGKDDMFSNGFVATKNGKNISGCVCSGFFKGNTIRLN